MSNKEKRLKGAELLDTPSERLKPKGLDEYYYDVAIDYPRLTQCEILQKAMELADIEGTATKQHANKIHARLRERINNAANDVATDLKYLCVTELRDMIVNTKSESVKLSAITLGTKDIFPSVTVNKPVNLNEMNSEIIELLKQIAMDEGKSIEQVVKEYEQETMH